MFLKKSDYNLPWALGRDTSGEWNRMKPHKYIVRLGSKEKQGLREIVGSGKSEARLVERARILLWAHDGVTIDETARRLGCHREKAIFWRKRYLERRREGIPTCLSDLPRSGRPPVFSP